MNLNEFLEEFRAVAGHSRRALTRNQLRSCGSGWVEEAIIRLEGAERGELLESLLCCVCTGHGDGSTDIGGLSSILGAMESEDVRLTPVLAILGATSNLLVHRPRPTNPYSMMTTREERERVSSQLVKKGAAETVEEQSHE